MRLLGESWTNYDEFTATDTFLTSHGRIRYRRFFVTMKVQPLSLKYGDRMPAAVNPLALLTNEARTSFEHPAPRVVAQIERAALRLQHRALVDEHCAASRCVRLDESACLLQLRRHRCGHVERWHVQIWQAEQRCWFGAFRRQIEHGRHPFTQQLPCPDACSGRHR